MKKMKRKKKEIEFWLMFIPTLIFLLISIWWGTGSLLLLTSNGFDSNRDLCLSGVKDIEIGYGTNLTTKSCNKYCTIYGLKNPFHNTYGDDRKMIFIFNVNDGVKGK